MTEPPTRCEWVETRNGETLVIVAERFETGWIFSERSLWEPRWYQAEPTAERVARAERFSRGEPDV